VTWEEMERAVRKKDAALLIFETSDLLKRIGDEGDLFAPVRKLRQKLPRLDR
jgi:bifunctional non-homologous end joining protein LigD